MPHYKNGELAEVGDIVLGTTYNTTGGDAPQRLRIGMILDITSDAESCNCIVGWSPVVEKADNVTRVEFAKTDYSEIAALKRLAGKDGLLPPMIADVDIIPRATPFDEGAADDDEDMGGYL